MKLLLLLLASLFNACAAFSALDCPLHHASDPRIRVFGSSCYVFVLDHTREHATAERECEVRGGHLATVRDSDTNEFLYKTMWQMGFIGVVYLGLSDSVSQGKWTWADGSTPTYTNWAPGHPRQGHRCATMIVSPRHGDEWYDYPCADSTFLDGNHFFICEYELGRKEDTTTTAPTTSSTTQTTTTTSATTTTTTARPTTTPTTVTTTTTSPTTTSTTPSTTTTRPTTTMTTSTTSTTTTTTTPVPTTTTTPQVDSGCPPFECSLDCGLSGYKISDIGCMLCECEN